MVEKSMSYYTLFDTELGACGMVWDARGILKLQLPKATKRETETLVRALGDLPAPKKLPPEIRRVIAKMQRYMQGKKVDFSDVPVFIDGTPFQRRIYQAVASIPWGETASYGDIARAAGSPNAARAVGRAMGATQVPIVIPAHRVLASGNKISGFSPMREKLLALEGVRLRGVEKPDLHMGEMDVKEVLRLLSVADPHLGKSIRATGDFLLIKKSEGSPFRALVRAIVYQQLATKAAASIFAKLTHVLNGQLTPQAISGADDDMLRMAGLSRSKMLSLRDLAKKTLAGEIPGLRALRAMSDEEVIARLTTVRGIGVWTAQMFLMFSLLRPNVLPATDYGVQKGFQVIYGTRQLPTPRAIEKQAVRWHPYKSVASWYCWRATDKPPK